MDHVIGVGLAAGRGVRFRPLTLKAKGYLRAKAAVRLLGRRVLDWIVGILQQQGVEDFIMVTKGKENRYQIKSIIGYGDGLGVRVRYSHVRYDNDNTGSADALLTNIDYFDISDTMFVFPTDSVLDIDLPAMIEAHRESGSVVTIAAAAQPAELIAGRYGLIDRTEQGRVRGFIEKPTLHEIYAHYGVIGEEHPKLPPLVTNAGFYLMDAIALRDISRHPDIIEMRKKQFDIGGDLLPWLVRHGYPVSTFEIGRMGDLGNIASYLETMIDVLHGRFPSMTAMMPRVYPGSDHILVDVESLEMSDPISHLTLAEKIEQGLVELRPPVRIGKYVRIYPGVTLSECNIDDDCEIFENTEIFRSSIGSGSLIGPYCHIEDTLTGTMVEIQSSREQPVSLKRHVAIGDETVIRGGVALTDSVTIYPRLKVPSGIHITPSTDIESAEQMLEYL
ncbi:MAG TPA: NDP-sugar synthase [Armatimonadota bacterium]|nr:NDP-sugar synthase [Armatimonadota bacterium]